MARRPRHSSPGAFYHVMLRGNNGQQIFSSIQERSQFCLLMQEGVERYGHRILAFCFMTNHVHLAIQVKSTSLSKICQNLTFRYTRFYNWRHDTIGHLFQGRFKSILVDNQRYLKELIRYIHLNPVRAKLVNDPLDYHWSSHQAYLMKHEFTWLARDDGLHLFGKSRQEAIDKFHQFVISGIGQSDGIDFKRGISQGILGDEIFIKKIQDETSIKGKENISKLPIINLTILISVITKWYSIDIKILQTPGIRRRESHIRAVMSLLVRDTQGLSLRELADFCGRSDNTTSQAAARLEVRMRGNDALKNEITDLKSELFLVSGRGYNQLCMADC